MRLPSKKRSGHPILAKDWNQLIEAIEARTPCPGIGLELVFMASGFTYRVRRSSALESGNQTVTCPFGEIITFKEGETLKTGIRGGVVYAGDKVWDIEAKTISLSATGSYKVWLEIGVTAHAEDGVLLPGLKTSSEPVWKQSSAQYPSQTLPTAPAGTGIAIVALGTLNIEDGKASFSRAACGSVRIDHCPGTLTHQRI
ncbi:MAG: hypothetical protein RLZZ245_3538 [Verrucomicrobiota bacterium]